MLGDSVAIPDYGTGVVRYVGPLHFQPGEWLGVELDTAGSACAFS